MKGTPMSSGTTTDDRGTASPVEQLVRLRLIVAYEDPKTILKIQRELERMGYTATGMDIQEAYRRYCLQEWLSPQMLPIGRVVTVEAAARGVFRRLERAI